MKVLLISANTEQFNMPAMPLGLSCVVEAVKNAGHDTFMLDLMFQMDVDATLKKIIEEFLPECIGISVRNIDDQNIISPLFLLEKVKEVVKICSRLSSAPIVLGGAGYSMFPESALTYLEADYGIEGEGEIAFPALLMHLNKNDDLTGIPGLHIRGQEDGDQKSEDRGQKSEIRGQGKTQARTLCTQLDKLTLPETGILSTSASRSQDPWIPVQTRRGCPLKCSYCSTPAIEGSILRKRSPEVVADWLKSWVKAGYSNFFFVDNTFNLPPSYAKSICREILKRELDMDWRAIIYPRNVDEELVELMDKAGCKGISLGFESGSPQILKNLNKKFTLEDVKRISTLFSDHGIERMGFLLLGGPGETKETVEESLAFADSLKLNAMRLTGGIRIYPDTQLAKTAKDQGVITSKTNLLYPCFYLSRELEEWLPERLNKWQSTRPYVMM